MSGTGNELLKGFFSGGHTDGKIAAIFSNRNKSKKAFFLCRFLVNKIQNLICPLVKAPMCQILIFYSLFTGMALGDKRIPKFQFFQPTFFSIVIDTIKKLLTNFFQS